MSTKQVKWTGNPPTKCDICLDPFKLEFFDARLRGMSEWASICGGCHETHGCGLGQGRGQKYERQPDDSWLKVAG